MKVVAFLHAPRSPVGAIGLGYARIQSEVESRGHQFQAVTPYDIGWVRSMPFRVHVFAFPIAVALRLWSKPGSVDLAIFHSYAGWVFNLWKRGLPTITAFHGIETIEHEALRSEMRRQGRALSWRYETTYGWLMNWWLRLTCRRSNRVLCLNSEEERLLIERGWTRRDAVVRVTHGVPPDGHVTSRVYAPVASRLLVVSQWLDRKGVRYIVDAFTTLVREGHDIELRCVGTRTPSDIVLASFPDDVRARVTQVESLPNEELLPEYRHADIFVHAALYEGMSRAQAEAMAAALPIVTTRCGAAAIDLLGAGDSCVMVPMHDAGAIADAIRLLIPAPGLRERLGRAAGAIARRRLQLAPTLSALVDVYETVAGVHPPAPQPQSANVGGVH